MQQRLYNPSSFAGQLSPEMRAWVQAVHKTLIDLLNATAVMRTQLAELQKGGQSGIRGK